MSTALKTNRAPHQDDGATDRLSFLWLAGFMAAFLVVDILSKLTEYGRNGVGSEPVYFAIYEITSFVVLLALFPAIAWLTSRATPGQHQWPYVIGAHGAASVIFSLIHVGLMVALRKLAFMLFLPISYTFSDHLPRDLIYEYRKDVLTYALFVFFITFGRQLAQQRREIAAAREDAKRSKKLTLKCGGRSIWVDAKDVCWVRSASNYVEVAANGKTHLARATLAAIERQLADAGANAVRVHRSYVVNTDHIREIRPNGEGDVKIVMSDDQIIPGSRRFRDRLPKAD
ncbi:hypothetical protein MNBD_ALPHA05-2402 [hydrothermal vent metagenome]|uniref:HTH LytTR-type domain-containing protein n=1 Tax=hydrothermal vent metagenome TaxID=652676 RepID=A0A3B0SKI7_9ZZZZ